jgi:hypothetical protein
MKRLRSLAAISSALLIYVSFAGNANAVIISEPPDFPDSIPGPADTIALDPGFNFIMGNSSDPGGTAAADLDDFVLHVPVGYLLTQMWFFWEVNAGSDVRVVETTFTLQGTTPSSSTITLLSDNPALEDTSPVVNMFDMPLGAGNYLLNQLSISIIGESAAAAADFDYVWKLKVAPVPLPPAAWLLISGLLAMAGLSRRQRAS